MISYTKSQYKLGLFILALFLLLISAVSCNKKMASFALSKNNLYVGDRRLIEEFKSEFYSRDKQTVCGEADVQFYTHRTSLYAICYDTSVFAIRLNPGNNEVLNENQNFNLHLNQSYLGSVMEVQLITKYQDTISTKAYIPKAFDFYTDTTYHNKYSRRYGIHFHWTSDSLYHNAVIITLNYDASFNLLLNKNAVKNHRQITYLVPDTGHFSITDLRYLPKGRIMGKIRKEIHQKVFIQNKIFRFKFTQWKAFSIDLI